MNDPMLTEKICQALEQGSTLKKEEERYKGYDNLEDALLFAEEFCTGDN